jgi:hypothetical protein
VRATVAIDDDLLEKAVRVVEPFSVSMQHWKSATVPTAITDGARRLSWSVTGKRVSASPSAGMTVETESPSGQEAGCCFQQAVYRTIDILVYPCVFGRGMPRSLYIGASSSSVSGPLSGALRGATLMAQ